MLEILPEPASCTGSVLDLPDEAVVCTHRGVTRGEIIDAILDGHCSLGALGHATGAGTGPACRGECHAQLGELIAAFRPRGPGHAARNKVERMKADQDGLDCLPELLHLAGSGDWRQLSEDDKQRHKWQGLFFRKQTPGHFMLRIRLTCGHSNARQWRAIADLTDRFGKGFCDLTTRQQIQMRWFTLADVPEIWRCLDEVGLTTRQTGMDNVRGVCGCPVSGLAA